MHRLGDRGARHEIAAKFREHHSLADRVRLVAAATDALEPAGHRRRRLDLHDEVDRAHVDAEFQRGRGDEPAQLSGLQQILDLDALRARDRAVVRADERFAGQLVQRAGEPFGQSAAVHEDERRAMRENQLQQSRMDGGPDRRPAIAERRRTAGDVIRRRQLRHVLDRHLDCQLQRLLLAGIDDGDRAVTDGALGGELVLDFGVRLRNAPLDGAPSLPRGGFGTTEKPRDFVERPLRRGQTDPLRRTLAEGLEPLERQREVRPALGWHERVDFVDDYGVDRPERLARVRGQEEVQRLGGGDQDVRRLALKARALGLWRVAGADGDGRRDVRLSEALGDLRDAGQRRAQVALDVDRERLERRHVEHAASPRFRRSRREHQAIEAPEEGRERLAAAGRREDERRVASCDRRPAERLRRRGRFERVREPRAHRRMKGCERIRGRASHEVIL